VRPRLFLRRCGRSQGGFGHRCRPGKGRDP